ncbi:MAG TPA: aldehyde dehydrogenase family protein [Actinocrinis sp.]|nr:aldehyde dehydrogenase family protein [Actinocrinis sp.]
METSGVSGQLDDRLDSLLIDGRWHPAADGRTASVVSPIGGLEPTRIADAGRQDVDAAVAAARRAFDEGPWPRMPGCERAQILYEAADLVEERTHRLALCQALEMGKPVHFGERDDGPFAVMALRFFAALASKLPCLGPRVTPSVGLSTSRRPIGVVAAVPAFHHPLAMAVATVAPALAVGDTVVLNAPLQASHSLIELAELCVAAGLPPGVLNVVTGRREAARVLAGRHGIDLTVYSGGARDGRMISMACARGLVPAELDVGRPNAHVVFGDADLGQAAWEVARSLLPGRAEFRASGIRVLVHESAYPEFTERLARIVRSLAPGDPRDRVTRLGPTADGDDPELLRDYLAWARDRGARLLDGVALEGVAHDGGAYESAEQNSAAGNGSYLPIRLLEIPDAQLALQLPEVFAPLALLMPFRSPESATAFVNLGQGTQYCTLHTADVKQARCFAATVRSRLCRITVGELEGGSESWHDDEYADESGPLREFDIESAMPYTYSASVWART